MKTKDKELRSAVDIVNEVIEVISDGKDEIVEEKNVIFDKKTRQYSFKIPKSLALKAKMTPNSKVMVVVNPSENTITDLYGARLVIFLKKEGDKGEKGT